MSQRMMFRSALDLPLAQVELVGQVAARLAGVGRDLFDDVPDAAEPVSHKPLLLCHDAISCSML
jgi:hypothetical protein